MDYIWHRKIWLENVMCYYLKMRFKKNMYGQKEKKKSLKATHYKYICKIGKKN